MAGQLVPLVLLPRYTTYAGLPSSGITYFSTIAMDVTPYSSAIVNIWRGKLVGTSPAIAFTFEESMDQVVWSECSVSPSGHDPGENTETEYVAALSKRWFRIKVELGSGNTVATCYAVGFLEERLS